MHRLRLTLLLLVLGSSLAYSQMPDRSGRIAASPCAYRNAGQYCASAAMPVPWGPPPPPTFQSLERDAALAQSRPSLAVRPAPRVAAASPQYEQSPRATPDAPDQSELLKNSKDPEFILRNFKTMYVETHDIDFFGADQMKAALYRNPDFAKLNIRIVEDRRVADAVLSVTYTFAWDYPFKLRHQNTTTVLLAGKGEGPFSGPLGAAEVAREFVELATPWRTAREQKK